MTSSMKQATANPVHPSDFDNQNTEHYTAELIPLTDNDGATAVMGRDLHEFLGIGKDYSTWFTDMTKYGFTENEDYIISAPQNRGAGTTSGFVPGGNRKDHIMTLDMAKEVAMIQRTDKGKLARQYFIEVEKRYKSDIAQRINDQFQIPQTLADALMLAGELEQRRAELEEDNKRLVLDNHTLDVENYDLSAKNAELKPLNLRN